MQAAPQASFQKEKSMYINDAILHFRDRKSSTVWKIDVISGVVFWSPLADNVLIHVCLKLQILMPSCDLSFQYASIFTFF